MKSRPLLALFVAALLTTLPLTVSAQSADPSTRITLPIRDQTVRGNVTVQGTAISPIFSRYELAYAQEPDVANWIVIGGSVQQVQDGTLGVWNTRPLADGAYALRLQVFGSDGSVSETLVRNLTLANTPAAPAPAITTIITDTTEAAPSTGVVAEVQTARDTLQVITSTISEMPDAFLRGARIGLLAFLALGAYIILKKVVLFAVQRLTRRPVDYGK